MAAEVEVGVAEGVQVAGAAEAMAGHSAKSEGVDAVTSQRRNLKAGTVAWVPCELKGGIFPSPEQERHLAVGGVQNYLSGPFAAGTTMLRCTEASWNRSGHDLLRDYFRGRAMLVAYRMSQMDAESPDPLLPGLVWGRGKWPSFQLAWHMYLGFTLYGPRFPGAVDFPSLYGLAFRYADLSQNGGRHTGGIRSQPNAGSLDRYVAAVLEGREEALDFTVHVPSGYERIGGSPVPNVQATADGEQMWTASFFGGRETWGVAI